MDWSISDRLKQLDGNSIWRLKIEHLCGSSNLFLYQWLLDTVYNMSPASRIRSYVQTRKDWLALKPFDADLEREFERHRVAEAIGPIVLLGLIGGLAFLLVLAMQTAENKTFQNYNIYTMSIRLVAGGVLISISLFIIRM